MSNWDVASLFFSAVARYDRRETEVSLKRRPWRNWFSSTLLQFRGHLYSGKTKVSARDVKLVACEPAWGSNEALGSNTKCETLFTAVSKFSAHLDGWIDNSMFISCLLPQLLFLLQIMHHVVVLYCLYSVEASFPQYCMSCSVVFLFALFPPLFYSSLLFQ